MKIEIASLEDAQELVEIYRYYVEKTAITFEYEVKNDSCYGKISLFDC